MINKNILRLHYIIFKIETMGLDEVMMSDDMTHGVVDVANWARI